MTRPVGRSAAMVVAALFLTVLVVLALTTTVGASHVRGAGAGPDTGTITTVELVAAQQRYMECLAPLGVRGKIEFDSAQRLPVHRFFSDAVPADEIVEGTAGTACYSTHLGDLEYRWADAYTGDNVLDDESFLMAMGTCMAQDGVVVSSHPGLNDAFDAAPMTVAACLDDVLAR